MASNVSEDIVYAQPQTLDERATVAAACVLHLELAMPTVLDDIDDTVDRAYAALPERLYVVDAEGIVAFQSGPGPWEFDVDGWEECLRSLRT